MQLLQAGAHQLILLELDSSLLAQGAQEAGLLCEITDGERFVTLRVEAPDNDQPLLLFDAADAGLANWFSRCQFYVDGRSGAVLQTPFLIANSFDRRGRVEPQALRIQVRKELPAHFRLPGRQPVNEKMLYAVLFNFLTALQKVGVGICGGPLVKPLATKADTPPSPPFTRG
ncbi:MAG: hypothetical protein KJZ84_01865 [Bryobacteraceae bacterium]|nr:hypothetical protein [Bryobacteraceae bacterium]